MARHIVDGSSDIRRIVIRDLPRPRNGFDFATAHAIFLLIDGRSPAETELNAVLTTSVKRQIPAQTWEIGHAGTCPAQG
jgi:hypothetical protein